MTICVLVSDDISDSALDVFAGTGWSIDKRIGLKPDELAATIGRYDALLVRSATKVDRRLLSAAERLRVVGRAGMGVDNIDVLAATERGIIVMNTPGANTISTAEHAMALLLAAAKSLAAAAASMLEHKWEKKKFRNIELKGKTLGIVGLGRIGQEVARRAAAFEMHVVAYDPFVSEQVARGVQARLLGLNELLAAADFITLHATLTPETKGLIGRAALERARPGVVLVNCARGELVDEVALLEALESGRVARAALDVFPKEPPADWTLISHPGVIATPHLAASTAEAQELVGCEIARQVRDFLERGIIHNAVNAPSIAAEDRSLIEPYLLLARRLGCVAAQLRAGRTEEVEVDCGTERLSRYARPMAASALAGVLSTIVDNVNEVNSLHLASSRGIRVLDASSERGEMLAVRLRTDAGEIRLEGTAAPWTGGGVRLMACDGFPLDIQLPGGGMLFIRNDDVPGVVGHIGTILGASGVNIGQMSLSRDAARAHALAVLTVDGPVPAEALAALRAAPSIVSAVPVLL